MMLSGICLNMCVCGALLRPIRLDTPHKFPNPKEDLKIREESREKKKTSLFNLSIFRNFHYLMLCLNNTFICYGLSVVYVHLPAYAGTLGFTENQGAWLFSVLGVSNFIGRIAFGLLAHIPAISSTSLYLCALSSVGVITLFVPLATSFSGLLAYAGVFGFLSAAFGALLPQVVVIVLLDLSLIASGYGYILIFEALGTLLGAPVAGGYEWRDFIVCILY